MRLLDPKIDVVFKLLFAAPRHESLLIAFLTAVLKPDVAITSAVVLNPEIPKDFTREKGVFLNVRVRLSDGQLVDLEMQARDEPAFRERMLYRKRAERAHRHMTAAAQELGRTQGMSEGEARGRAEGILTVLEARGFQVNPMQRQQILACTDHDQLSTCLRRSATLTDVDALLA